MVRWNRGGFRKWRSSLEDGDGSWEKALRAQVTSRLPGDQEHMAGRLTLWATGADRKCPGQVDGTWPLTL